MSSNLRRSLPNLADMDGISIRKLSLWRVAAVRGILWWPKIVLYGSWRNTDALLYRTWTLADRKIDGR
ncbi:hypothetical protein GGD50_003384 [Rhizobium paranaense]|uniref:Uncharacterized protein n=1 Tax=Rhizobium paranaense TaxID=1650438 RepID=A0A7W8XSU9_9HYPH|nr:hypothetical protein [Rhizobium paranaense]